MSFMIANLLRKEDKVKTNVVTTPNEDCGSTGYYRKENFEEVSGYDTYDEKPIYN